MDNLRNMLPLSIRKKIGPCAAYITYAFNVYFRPRRNRPRVLPLEQTLDLIREKKLSAIRFGDGEMSLIGMQDLAFQKYNPVLAQKLQAALQSTDERLLICIPGIWERIGHFSKRSFWFTLHHLFRYGKRWKSLLDMSQTYGDAFITRPYLNYKESPHSAELFKKIMSLWEGANAVLIEGETSRLGIGNDLFENTASLQRILCPAENAFSEYGSIKIAAMTLPKDRLILLSLGPTAKVLGLELFKAGYRVLDIGHIDMEYEMFLRNSRTIVKVPHKYFNEIDERNPQDCKDEKYQRQIITHIRSHEEHQD